MKAIFIITALLSVGCHESVTGPTQPPESPSTPNVPVAVQCVTAPPVLDEDAVNMAGPYIKVWMTAQGTMEREVLTGDGWNALEQVPFTVNLNNIPALNGYKHRIRATVAPCKESIWVEVEVGLKNVNASGGKSNPNVPAAKFEWSQCVSAPRDRGIIDETITPPVTGSYTLTVTTSDQYHAPGYQSGQVETLMVTVGDWVGFTNDIPDVETEVETSWSAKLSGPIRLQRSQGSLHGVCVTVRQ